jgi:hypothetical protein
MNFFVAPHLIKTPLIIIFFPIKIMKKTKIIKSQKMMNKMKKTPPQFTKITPETTLKTISIITQFSPLKIKYSAKLLFTTILVQEGEEYMKSKEK